MILDEADRSETNSASVRDADGYHLTYKDALGDRDKHSKYHRHGPKAYTYTSAQWKGKGYYRLVWLWLWIICMFTPDMQKLILRNIH